jgi:hypothetical protein
MLDNAPLTPRKENTMLNRNLKWIVGMILAAVAGAVIATTVVAVSARGTDAPTKAAPVVIWQSFPLAIGQAVFSVNCPAGLVAINGGIEEPGGYASTYVVHDRPVGPTLPYPGPVTSGSTSTLPTGWTFRTGNGYSPVTVYVICVPPNSLSK